MYSGSKSDVGKVFYIHIRLDDDPLDDAHSSSSTGTTDDKPTIGNCGFEFKMRTEKGKNDDELSLSRLTYQ